MILIKKSLTSSNRKNGKIYKGDNFNTGFIVKDAKWDAKMVNRVITNKVYIGVLEQGKTAKLNYKSKREVDVAKDDWITIENAHESIVFKSVFALANKMLLRDVKASKENPSILSGMLYCKDCGSPMIRRKVKSKDGYNIFYICSEYNIKGECTRHSIKEDYVIGATVHALNDYLSKYNELLKKLSKIDVSKLTIKADFDSLNVEKKKYERLRGSLYMDLEEELITTEEFERFRKNYLLKIREIEKQIITKQKMIEELKEKIKDNPILDNAFIYSNDQSYIADVLRKGEGSFIATYELQEGVPDFQLISVKPNARSGLTNAEVVAALRSQFKKDYGLVEQNGYQNQEKLESFGYQFGTNIRQKLSQSDKLERDILSDKLQSYQVGVTVNLKGNRLDLLNAEQKIQSHLYRDTASDVNAILVELFSNRSEEPQKRFLTLKPSEFMAFVINNYRLIRNTVKNADAQGLFDKQLSLEYGISHDEVDLVPFVLPKYEMYQVLKGQSRNVFTKNVYQGYGENNWGNSKAPEIAFEKWLEETTEVAWWYRSKDRGEKYFSVAYGHKAEGFFPDYIFKGRDGVTYIVETKGGNKQNIDRYSEAKFKALREWSENPKTNPHGAKIAFVRPIKNSDGEVIGMLFNNTSWKEDMTDSIHWKPISKFFSDDLL